MFPYVLQLIEFMSAQLYVLLGSIMNLLDKIKLQTSRNRKHQAEKLFTTDSGIVSASAFDGHFTCLRFNCQCRPIRLEWFIAAHCSENWIRKLSKL